MEEVQQASRLPRAQTSVNESKGFKGDSYLSFFARITFRETLDALLHRARSPRSILSQREEEPSSASGFLSVQSA